MRTIKRPPLQYFGGKWTLAPWIIDHFPRGFKNYVEPCFGGGSVLFQKPRSELETVNDIDGNVVNYFEILRDKPDELIRALRLTPWARAEFATAVKYDDPNVDAVERARRFAAFSFMAISKRPAEQRANQWRNSKQSGARWVPLAFDLKNVSTSLDAVAERLIGVQIENRDWLEIVNDYANDDSLIYFDPPYPKNTRSQANGYLYEWENVDHEMAAMVLNDAPGFVVISSYDSPLYRDLYERRFGWSRFDSEPMKTNSGGRRVESIWLSPRTVDALKNDYGPLFDYARGNNADGL